MSNKIDCTCNCAKGRHRPSCPAFIKEETLTAILTAMDERFGKAWCNASQLRDVYYAPLRALRELEKRGRVESVKAINQTTNLSWRLTKPPHKEQS